MKHQIIIFCVLLLSLTGCERYEEIEVEANYKPKVVVASFLRGQSNILEAAVTRSRPVFGKVDDTGAEPAPDYITDATVIIKQGTTSYQLLYDPLDHLYRLEIPEAVKGGDEYELTVLSGTTSMKGKTTIPGVVNVDMQLRFDSILQLGGGAQYIATITYKVLDPGKHYIQIYPMLVYPDSSRDMMYIEGISTIDEISSQQTITKRFVSTSVFPDIYPDHMEVMIVNGDMHFAKNSKRFLDLFGGSDVSPFVEPAITYSSMSGGGIGSFGSFNPETRYYLNLK